MDKKAALEMTWQEIIGWVVLALLIVWFIAWQLDLKSYILSLGGSALE